MSRSEGDSWPNSRSFFVKAALTFGVQLRVMHTPDVQGYDLCEQRKVYTTSLLRDIGGRSSAMGYDLRVSNAKLQFGWPRTGPMFETPGQTTQRNHFLCLQLLIRSSV